MSGRTDPFSVVPDIDAALRGFVGGLRVGDRLRDAISYSLLSGGKRLRPVLAWHSCRALGGEGPESVAACVAIELIHCFSLVHDDLPAMDDDDLRRGIPTLHKHAGEAMAILAGDEMVTLAFEVLASGAVLKELEARPAMSVRLVRELARGTSAMITGQVYDTIAGAAPEAGELDRVRCIHRHKTGALIRASCVMGGLCAGLSRKVAVGEEELEALGGFGDAIGLMFQIVDDLIDVEQSGDLAGKRTGKDVEAGKLTYPLAYGGGTEGAARCRVEIEGLREAAMGRIAPLGSAADALRELCTFLATRTR